MGHITRFIILCSILHERLCHSMPVTPKLSIDEQYNRVLNEEGIVNPTSRESRFIYKFLHANNDIDNQLSKIKDLNKEIGVLHSTLKTRDRVLRVLSICARIQDLVRELYPGTLNKGTTVYDAFKDILESDKFEYTNNSAIVQFRDRVSKSGLTVEQFLNVVQKTELFSDQAVHEMSRFALAQLKFVNETTVSEMLRSVGIIPDMPVVLAVKVILEPLPMPSATETTTAT